MDKTILKLFEAFNGPGSVTTDSRAVKQGDIFFALKGDNFNGNRFAEAALHLGASIAVVDDPAFAKENGYLLVDDSLRTLQQFARQYRESLKTTTFIGITGSNGKTTSKELFHRVLSQKYKTTATSGNLNNHIGVPLTLLSIPEDTEMAIIEMGANHIGEIATLCEIARPEYGLITNIGKAHLEGFGGFEGVKKAKSELYDFIRKTDGKIFISNDNHILTGLAVGLNQVKYGSIDGVFCKGDLTAQIPFIQLDVECGETQLKIESSLIGAYNFENILSAVCAGFYFEVPASEISTAIETYHPDNNRSQIIETGKNTLILDAYNANPSSMNAALVNFFQGDYQNRVIVLGEMLELGEQSEAEHRQVIEQISNALIDQVFLVGDGFKSFANNRMLWFDTVESMISWLKDHPITGKHFLIKGSRKNRLEKLVEHL
ncbi:MAG: UDP-N-acetylmuramoyl-tripeptide--D-alanyl-D-alanine ligase [Bacteroidales bacterium]|nr:UDP-N-acetylmuramoyl-tripeptide--D-alanyl-D-alanine ligase [Bacteroidales bacterium]